MFAPPHHLESSDGTTSALTTQIRLQTTTKGLATAILANSWTMVEKILPIDMGFAPWRPGNTSVGRLSSAAVAAVHPASVIETSQNMSAQTNLDSMYHSGKGLGKFAQIVNELAQQQGLSATALAELKSAFAVFTSNQQQFPLVFDCDWKGVVLSAAYVTGDSEADFGNSYYNDHHFHYDYFINAAAVIGSLDPSWLVENMDNVNALVRDVRILVRETSTSLSFAHSTGIVATRGQKALSNLGMARMRSLRQKMPCLPTLSKWGQDYRRC
jgi:endo-1,3(4)-beta-glucanase